MDFHHRTFNRFTPLFQQYQILLCKSMIMLFFDKIFAEELNTFPRSKALCTAVKYWCVKNNCGQKNTF